MASRNNLIADIIFFIKNDLDSNITDPISSSRSSKSSFVMTAYPQRPVQYPIITIKTSNVEALRAGMQTDLQDITLTLEIRVWARNEKEKEEIYTEILNRLANIQFTTGTGSIANDFHDFNVLSSNEVDEEGESGGQVIKSRIMQCQYSFFSI